MGDIPNTIIIESNRLIAYKDAINSITKSGTTSITDQIKSDFPNNRWTTHLEWGQQIKTGDSISLEASMINDIGGGDSVMEFIGKTGNTVSGGQPIDDSRASLTFGYYINNRYQFNFIHPKSSLAVVLDLMAFDYGGPLLDGQGYPGTVPGFDTFRRAYPYQSMEGFSRTNVIPRSYTPLPDTDFPTYMKPNEEIYNPSDHRFYIGQEHYTGPYFDPTVTAYEQIQVWQYHTSKCDFEVPQGFSTPGAIGERLTSQLHQRDGPSSNWVVKEVLPSQFSIDTTGVITQKIMPGISDQTYRTFATSTGSLFYARASGETQQSGWQCAFAGEKSNGVLIPVGTNYKSYQGQYQFWRQTLCANCPSFIGNGIWMELSHGLCVSANFPIVLDNLKNLWTGPTSQRTYYVKGIQYDYGVYGTNTFIMDNMKELQGPFNYTNSLVSTYTTALQHNPTAGLWDLRAGDLISLNILLSDSTLQTILKSFTASSYLSEAVLSNDQQDQQYKDATRTDFVLGRIDDESSLISANRVIYLTNPYMKVQQDGATQYFNSRSSSSVFGPQMGRSYSTDMFTQNMTDRNDPDHNFLFPRLYGGSREKFRRMEVPVYSWGDKNFNYLSAQANSLTKTDGTLIGQNLYPHNPISYFQTSIPSGDITLLKTYWDLIDSMGDYGLGVIPVFLTEDTVNEVGGDFTGLLNVPFLAVISSIYSDAMPFPSRGEFFGNGSPTLTQNNIGKLVTTQKTSTAGYTQAGDLTPENYMPYMYCGSSDSLINFDDNYGRFTLSNFHTPVKPGNGVFQNINLVATNLPESDVMSVYEQQSAFCTIGGDGNPTSYSENVAVPSPQPVISSQGGIGLMGLTVYVSDGKDMAQSIPVAVSNTDETRFTNTLFNKLGFSLEQLLPLWGTQNNEFNRGNYNRYLGYGTNIDPYNKELNMVKPFTTNAYISASIVISLAQGIAVEPSASPPAGSSQGAVPSANFGAIIAKEATTNATSDLLIASGMAQKLDYPYLVVYTDIVRNPLYYGGPDGRQKLKAIAYITRNYAEGDFFYSFSTGWNYTADQDYILTDITTDIRLPDGSPAPIDKNSSVIYKIQTSKAMPNPPAIVKAVEIDNENMKKANKK